MAAEVTSRLPREQGRVQLASQEWRLSVGEKTGNGTRNLGYWILKTRSRERGAKVVYQRDQRVQSLLEQIADDPKPKVIPCTIIGNPVADDLNPGKLTLPDSIIFREIATFGNSRRLCYCQNPYDTKPIAHRAIQETVTRGGKQFKAITGYKELPCSRDSVDKPCLAFNSDPPQCKPHVIVPLYLPWTGSSGAAVYRTTGWTSFDSMTDSLLAIAAMTNGWLHGLPLELVYEEKQVGSNWVPAPRFRLVAADAKAALLTAGEMRMLCAGDEHGDMLRQQAETVRASIASSLADPTEQRETQEEFWPGVQDGEFEHIVEEPAARPSGEPSAEEAAAIKQAEAEAYERDFGGGNTRRLIEE